MRWRTITESEVELAVLHPDFMEPAAGTRVNAWKKFPERYLRVTYMETEEEAVVLSTVKKKKGWR